MNNDQNASSDRRSLLKAGALGAIAVASVSIPSVSLAQERSNSWRRRKRYTTVRGIRMAYYEVGKGSPIVFLHGNPTSSYLWRNIIPHVQHLGRCIAPDMVGMGDSQPLPDSAAGRYTFSTHREYLFGLLDALGVKERVTLVVHDWGSAMGFSWAQQYPERVRGIAYMEAIFDPLQVPRQEPASGPFAIFRSPAGERAVLQENMFVEQLLIGGLGPYLSEADKAEYRRPYLTPGESRRPTLEWPRELPGAGKPPATAAAVRSYTEWLARDERIPKLFFRALPGAILANPQLVEYVRTFKNQKEITVYGTHYVQETAPDAIGRSLTQWIGALA